ncbi:hypothetical protein HKX48_006755 [Thoreauomyces humboldtii]|nr:hypothetical protein HKX48_006755 [Thoreauomyces humboldtii]
MILSAAKTLRMLAFVVVAAQVAVSHALPIGRDAPVVPFITRNGATLMDGNKPFRFASFNIPSLFVTEDVGALHDQAPADYEQWDLLRSIKLFAGTNTAVARSYVFTIAWNVTDPENFHMKGLGDYNELVWARTDTAIALAAQQGVRLIIPIIDWWSYHGGVAEFAAYRGKAKWDFFTDGQLRNDFKSHITHCLNRVNTLTGVAYKDDPTIMMWEIGNELGEWNGIVPPDWTLDIAQHVKTTAPKQLVGDASINQMTVLGEFNPTTKQAWGYNHTRKFDVMAAAGILDSPYLDVISDHYYDAMGANDWMDRAADGSARVAQQHLKVYYIGEFGFEGEVVYRNLLNSMVKNPLIAGAAIWSLRGHSRFGGYYRHYERTSWFSYHLPGYQPGFSHSASFDLGSNSDELDTMRLMRSVNAQLAGLATPVPYPIPDQPQMLPITVPVELHWLGVPQAGSYEVWRDKGDAGQDGGWTLVAQGVTDALQAGAVLWTDNVAALTCGILYSYLVRAVSESGPGPFADPVTVTAC